MGQDKIESRREFPVSTYMNISYIFPSEHIPAVYLQRMQPVISTVGKDLTLDMEKINDLGTFH